MKKLIALLMAMAMVFALVACGNNDAPVADAPANDPVSDAPAVDAPADEPAVDAPADNVIIGNMEGVGNVVPAADGDIPTLDEFVACLEPYADESKSGNLVVYTTSSEQEMEAGLAMFNALFPNIKVEFITAGTAELIARIEAEAANPQGDIMWGGVGQSSYDSQGHLFEKYQPANYANLKEVYQTDQNINWNNCISSCLMVNEALEEELGITVNSYEDLLQPELKGWIISADPLASSTARVWMMSALLAHGGVDSPEAWDYVDKLIDQLDGYLGSSSSNVYTMPVTGEFAVGLGPSSETYKAQRDGAGVRYVAIGPTIEQAYGHGMIKGAPNAENAKLFMDFLLSDAMQSYYMIMGSNSPSATATVYDENLTAALENLVLADVDWATFGEQTDSFKAQWAEHWG